MQYYLCDTFTALHTWAFLGQEEGFTEYIHWCSGPNIHSTFQLMHHSIYSTCLCTGKQWLWCTSFWTIWLHKTSRCHCAIYLSFFPDNMVAQDIKTWLECIITLHYSSFIPNNTIAHVQDIKVSPIALYLEPGKMPKCTSTCNAIHILCSAPPIPTLISTKKVSGCHSYTWMDPCTLSRTFESTSVFCRKLRDTICRPEVNITFLTKSSLWSF